MKSVRRIFLYALITVSVLVVAGFLAAYFFRDKIVARFIEEANKHLATPVSVGRMDISFFEDFPNISLTISEVTVEDSHPGVFPLFKAKRVAFSFNALEAWNGKYSIRGLRVSNSQTHLRLDKKGINNYHILKDSVSQGKNIGFDIQDIILKNSLVTYVDEKLNQNHGFNSDQMIASIAFKGGIYLIETKGDLSIEQIGIGNQVFLKDKKFFVQTVLDFDDETDNIKFRPSVLSLNRAQFDISGTYDFKTTTTVDLELKGRKTDIKTILSFLPKSMERRFEKYESDGEVFFNIKLKGAINQKSNPSLAIKFGCHKATLFHPQTKFKIESANLDGSFTCTRFSDLSDATLQLKDINGRLNGKEFTGKFLITDFNNPYIDADFKGALEASSLVNIVPDSLLTKISGSLNADISMVGQIEDLKSKATAQRVKTTGTIELQHVSFSYGSRAIRLSGINGGLRFNNNDLALSGVSGKLGKSDFVLNGFFKNIVAFLLFDHQPIGIDTRLQSHYMDMDDLLAIGFGQENKAGYRFSISPDIHLNFKYDIHRLKYRRFNSSGLKGELLVKNQIAISKNNRLSSMGGQMKLDGFVDAGKEGSVLLSTNITLEGLHVDSIFYVFEDFKQTFIQQKNLKGQAVAAINLEVILDENLNIKPETMIADIDVLIKKGELNNFAPIQKLSQFLDDDGLKRLRFADLKNEIHIENQIILLPRMDIRSNLTTIQVSGRQTFDGKIDYRIAAPLSNKWRINVEEAGKAFEEDNLGRAKVYFKITGTTDSYQVAYDVDAVKNKISKDIKKEFEELKSAFKIKGKEQKKKIEVEKDDYFDWDNNP